MEKSPFEHGRWSNAAHGSAEHDRGVDSGAGRERRREARDLEGNRDAEHEQHREHDATDPRARAHDGGPWLPLPSGLSESRIR
jgi:hypothetical protein